MAPKESRFSIVWQLIINNTIFHCEYNQQHSHSCFYVSLSPWCSSILEQHLKNHVAKIKHLLRPWVQCLKSDYANKTRSYRILKSTNNKTMVDNIRFAQIATFIILTKLLSLMLLKAVLLITHRPLASLGLNSQFSLTKRHYLSSMAELLWPLQNITCQQISWSCFDTTSDFMCTLWILIFVVVTAVLPHVV